MPFGHRLARIPHQPRGETSGTSGADPQLGILKRKSRPGSRKAPRGAANVARPIPGFLTSSARGALELWAVDTISIGHACDVQADPAGQAGCNQVRLSERVTRLVARSPIRSATFVNSSGRSSGAISTGGSFRLELEGVLWFW